MSSTYWVIHVDGIDMSWQPGAAFNALPELPPPVDLEPKAVLKACIRARAALAELNAAVDLIRTRPS
jgi:hypothetical protein